MSPTMMPTMMFTTTCHPPAPPRGRAPLSTGQGRPRPLHTPLPPRPVPHAVHRLPSGSDAEGRPPGSGGALRTELCACQRVGLQGPRASLPPSLVDRPRRPRRPRRPPARPCARACVCECLADGGGGVADHVEESPPRAHRHLIHPPHPQRTHTVTRAPRHRRGGASRSPCDPPPARGWPRRPGQLAPPTDRIL